MVTSSLAGFFAAMAGASATLLGLLFVAVTVAPERTIGHAARVEHEAVASSAFTALLNAFLVSAAALLPDGSIASVALALSLAGLVSTAYVAVRSAPSNVRHLRVRSLRRARRAVGLTIILVGSAVVFSAELVNALGLRNDPTNAELLLGLAKLVLAVSGIALVRAWELVGAPRFGVSGWLNPLGDIDDEVQTARSVE